MFRLARGALRKRGSRRHTPSTIECLSTPAVHRQWGDLHALKPTEVEELLHGTWRQAKTLELAPDETDRDRGGFAEGKVSFVSQEAAQSFLTQESTDDDAERRIPTLTLSQIFFNDLAATADEEMDPLHGNNAVLGNRDGMTPAEARRDEADDVQRHFFADYYTEHGLLSPEQDRFAFVNASMTPAPALVEVNCEKPLVRLTVRDQMETHADGVFSPAADGDPLAYCVDAVPWQPYGAPLKLPYTAHTSFLVSQESGEAGTVPAALEGAATGTSSTTPVALPAEHRASEPAENATDADALAAFLNDEETAFGDGKDAATSVSHDSEQTAAAVSTLTPSAPTPPSFAHTQWLQRQVATGALIPVDILGRAVTMLAARWAFASPSAVLSGARTAPRVPPPLILDLFGAKGKQRSDLYRDIARALYRTLAEAGETQQADEALPTTTALNVCGPQLLPCVVVCLPGASKPAKASPQHGTRTRATAEEVPSAQQRGLSSDLAERIPLADQSPHLLYVQYSAPPRRRAGHAHGDNTLAHACDVVLCMPPTTEDGRRPRTIFGDAENVDEDTHALSANTFIALCARARDGFPKLAWQLSLALTQYATSGGLVLYATYSMNPLENEAVVAAAIQQAESQGYKVTCLSLRDGVVMQSIDRVSDGETQAVWRALLSHGQPGLSEWAPVEGGDPRHEPQATPLSLRQAIAAAAWRLRPDQDPCDGGFLIALRVHHSDMPQHTVAAADDANSDLVQSFPYCLDFGGANPDSSTVRLLSLSCASWWSAVRRSPNTCWSASAGGVVIGSRERGAGNLEDTERTHLALSSGINNTEYGRVVAQLLPHTMHGVAGLEPLPEVRVAVPVLYAVLRRGFVRGSTLDHARRAAQESDPVTAQALGDLMDVLVAIVKAESAGSQRTKNTQRAQRRGGAARRRVSLLVTPTLPVNALMDKSLRPHEALVEELEEVRVGLSLTFHGLQHSHGHRSELGRSAQPDAPFSFSLGLSVPHTVPGRRHHVDALKESSAGLQDALRYVMRRCGLSEIVLPQEETMSNSAEEDVEVMDMQQTVRDWSDGARGEGTPQTSYDVFGADTAPGSAAELLSHREQHSRQRRIHSLEKQMQSAGLGQDSPTSWSDSIHYGSLRRSGRG